MQRKILILLIMLAGFSAGLSAQTHNAVSLQDGALYEFLEQAEMRGWISPLSRVKPYARSYVVSLLEEMDRGRRRMTPAEQEVFQDFYDSYVVDQDKKLLQDGDVRVDHALFPLRAAVSAELGGSANLTELKDSGLEASGTVSLTGDAGPVVSWGIGLIAGGYKVDEYDEATSYGPTAWEPYTYTKSWDGGVHPLNSLNNFEGMPTDPSVGTGYETEIAASFWDNKADFRFGRLRREWGGVGEGSLFLNADAMPFMAYEGVIRPFDWVAFSFLTGTLDYGEDFRSAEDYSIKSTSRTQQNMFSLLHLELMPADWLYLSVFDGGIYLKRPESGYAHPLMSRFFNQNSVGDFDNMAMGGSLALSKAGLGKLYTSVFLDEAKFNKPDFFGNYGNMYSIQAGVEAPIPGLPLTTGLFQYTKIEPFTYTHYRVDNSPWYYDLAMETGFMNGGESMGYGLEPNSDEFLLRLKSLPKRGVSLEGGYRLVRHGTNPGSYFQSWGSSDEDDSLNADNDPNGAYSREDSKDFLKDAVYEWFHMVTLGGDWDLTSRGQPVSFGLAYSYVFKYYTDYPTSGDFSPVDQGSYENEHRHLVTFAVRIYP